LRDPLCFSFPLCLCTVRPTPPPPPHTRRGSIRPAPAPPSYFSSLLDAVLAQAIRVHPFFGDPGIVLSFLRDVSDLVCAVYASDQRCSLRRFLILLALSARLRSCTFLLLSLQDFAVGVDSPSRQLSLCFICVSSIVETFLFKMTHPAPHLAWPAQSGAILSQRSEPTSHDVSIFLSSSRNYSGFVSEPFFLLLYLSRGRVDFFRVSSNYCGCGYRCPFRTIQQCELIALRASWARRVFF